MLLSQLRNMLPRTLDKKKMLEQIDKVDSSISEHVLPNYRIAGELRALRAPKDKTAKELVAQIDKIRGVKGNFAEKVHFCMTNAQAILGFVSTYSDKIFANNEATMGMSYSKITIVRVLQAADFASTYARHLLNYVVFLESQKDAPTEAPSKAMVKFLDDKILDFTSALVIMSTDVKDFEKHLKSLPDAVVNEKTESAFGATMGFAKLDPFGLRNFSVSWNPFYHIGMMRAQYQEEKYREAKEEAQLLQLRLQQLESLTDGQQDASVQKEIDILQDKVTTLQFKIHTLEDEYELAD